MQERKHGVAIDPGVRKGCGVATFKFGTLVEVGLLKIEQLPAYIQHLEKAWGMKEELLVIEKPVVRSTRFQKGRQSDIVDLAVAVGRCRQAFEAAGWDVLELAPEEWKAQLPKDITTRRIHERLDNEERLVAPGPAKKNHDLYDSIGIGLHVFSDERRLLK